MNTDSGAKRSVCFVGDIFVQEENPERALAGSFDVLHAADVRVGNLEIPICDVGTPLPKTNSHLRADPSMIAALTAARFDCMSVANNHMMNYGAEGLDQSLRLLDEVGIGHCGGGGNLAEAHRPFIGESNGWRYAVLSYTSVYARNMFEATADRGGLATVQVDTSYEPRIRHFEVPGMPPIIHCRVSEHDIAVLKADIAAVRDTVDAVIVAWHWGVSIVSHDVVDYQREMGRMAIDAGADAVIGHHPHNLQPLDFYNGKPIFYCIGNFHHALGADDFPSSSAIFEVIFDTHGGESEVRVHPLSLDKGSHPISLKLDDPISVETQALMRLEGAVVEPSPDGTAFVARPA